jgi:hypothetical protein
VWERVYPSKLRRRSDQPRRSDGARLVQAFGADLLTTGLTSHDAQTARAAYLSMEVI